MDETSKILFEYLKNVLYHPESAQLELSSLAPEFHKLGQGMQFLADCIQEERTFVRALANGDLSMKPPGSDNILADSAKALQNSLRHLQWQTQQVAKGDYSQRVDFMGEFSNAFNTMTTQLAQRTEGLIAEKKLVEQKNLELKRNLELMLALTNYTHNMIFVFSAETEQQIFANQPAEWFLQSLPTLAGSLQEQLRVQTLKGQNGSLNWEISLPSGTEKETVYYSIESFSIYLMDEPAIVHIVIDETKRKTRENLIYSLAYKDPLTSLNNRRYAMDLMEHWLKEETPFLLSFIDVDYLKYCNDTFGHEKGDQYLIDIANLLNTMHCEVCRIGGDEFFLLTPGTDATAQDEQLTHLREFLLAQTDTPYPQSFSFATTAVPAAPTASLSDYITTTDENMYRYKVQNKRPLSEALYQDQRIF